jgi:hypothetical protein
METRHRIQTKARRDAEEVANPKSVTADDILKELIAIFPDFAAYWETENYFREDDGSFNAHGAFAHFTGYFREQHSTMSKEQLQALGTLITQCDGDDASENAAYTCFLENIAGDAEDAMIAPYLSPKAIEFMNYWRY